MKILVIYPYFGTPEGSWSTRMYELTRRWVIKGYDVEVLTAPYEKSDIRAQGFISQQEVSGVQLIVIDSPDNNRMTVLARSLRAILFALISTYYALTRKYDILLASSGPITVGIPMLAAKFLRKKKTVFEVRDLWPEGAVQLGKIQSKVLIRLARWFEAKCYENSDLVVAASPGMEAGVKNVNPNVKTIMIPNASDIELFDIPYTKPKDFIDELEGRQILLYAGSLGFMDEIESAIRAMRAFTSESLAFVILGEGEERQKLELLAKEIGNSNVYFLGLLPKIEVVKWYSIATASIVGFKNYEVLSTSSPNKMFDSFAAGVPVIQNTTGWIKEMIDENGGGYNVDYQSVESYIEVFEQILNNKIDLDRRGRQAYELALNRFNRDIIAHDYYKTLRSLV